MPQALLEGARKATPGPTLEVTLEVPLEVTPVVTPEGMLEATEFSPRNNTPISDGIG